MQVIIDTNNTDLNQPLIATYSFELDKFQKNAINAIHQNHDVLVTAHTGSGKTVVAEYAILNAIKNNKRAVYTSPIKSLSNEKYNEFKNKFSDITIGLLTGDNKINPDAQCIIMTAEILRNSLYKLKTDITKLLPNDFIQTIGCVVIDEVHYINDQDRGRVWEETIMFLPSSIQLVMLSATIDKSEEFAKWIMDTRQVQIHLVPTSMRAVPLRHYLYSNKKLYTILDENDNYIKDNYISSKQNRQPTNNRLQELVDYLQEEDMLQVIFFSFSRLKCESYAKQINKNLVSPEERANIERIFNFHMHKFEKKYETLDQYIRLKKLISEGIAFHHSGLLPVLKEIVEIIFKAGLIKVLFATETFAVGVNMPTRTVVFTELEKFTNKEKRLLNTAEYKQMSGRAGRRGLDKIGHCIILPWLDEHELQLVLLNKMPCIKSKFKIDEQLVLKLLANNLDINIMYSSLYNKEQQGAILNIQNDIDALDKLITNNTNNPEIILEYLKLVKYIEEGFTLNPKQRKRYDTLKLQIINTPELNAILENNKNIKKRNILEKDLDNLKKYMLSEYNYLIKYFIDIGYYSNNALTIKGQIASNINDCNCILLTELILEGHLDRLTPQELVGILGIFIEDKIQNSEQEELVLDNKNLLELISTIKTISNNLYYTEEWDNNYYFINIAYRWACGINYIDNCYEGNFIRHMLKIYNIIQNMKLLCDIGKKLELIPILEQTDGLIIRDLVDITSLYLN